MMAVVVIQWKPIAAFMSGSFICHMKMEDGIK
jgi:hypothetical protein